MIAYVKGILEELTEDGVIVEAGGIGYGITVPSGLLAELQPGHEVKLYTYYQVLEDSQKLFGFRTREERALFLQILRVSGIGSKVAMSVLSTFSPEELTGAVVAGDVKTLCRAPGLGKKIAEKLILELKDKVDLTKLVAPAASAAPTVLTDAYSDAVAALVSLGYSSVEALRVVRSIDGAENMTTEDVLQEAFRKLAAF